MDIQDLGRMKFFFWDDTLQREYKVIQNRLDGQDEKSWKSDTERMKGLMARYGSEFKVELRKIAEYLESFMIGSNYIKKENIDVDIEEFKFTYILKQDNHQFVIKGYSGLNKKAYISIIINNTERKFFENTSLVNALKTLSDKLGVKQASVLKVSADFNQSLKVFIDYIKDIMTQHYDKMTKENSHGYKWHFYLEPQMGSKLVKLVTGSTILEAGITSPLPRDFNSKTVWGFVDKNNGDIFKANSWNSAHPKPRANIYNKETWKNVSVYGPNYLK